MMIVVINKFFFLSVPKIDFRGTQTKKNCPQNRFSGWGSIAPKNIKLI